MSTCYLGKTGYARNLCKFHQRNPNFKGIFPSNNLETGFLTLFPPRIKNVKVKIPLVFYKKKNRIG